jgi:hypothetical protein
MTWGSSESTSGSSQSLSRHPERILAMHTDSGLRKFRNHHTRWSLLSHRGGIHEAPGVGCYHARRLQQPSSTPRYYTEATVAQNARTRSTAVQAGESQLRENAFKTHSETKSLGIAERGALDKSARPTWKECTQRLPVAHSEWSRRLTSIPPQGTPGNANRQCAEKQQGT